MNEEPLDPNVSALQGWLFAEDKVGDVKGRPLYAIPQRLEANPGGIETLRKISELDGEIPIPTAGDRSQAREQVVCVIFAPTPGFLCSKTRLCTVVNHT